MTQVFISYSHDSDQHRKFVLDLANQLRTDEGIDCIIDQHFLPGFPPDGWIKWMRDNVTTADFVLLICTPQYRQRFERNVEEGGRGVGFEGVVISQALYDQYYRNQKFIPVIPESGDLNDVPLELQHHYTTYCLPKDYNTLCDLLKGKLYNPPPPLGFSEKYERENNLETQVTAYLDWVKNKFLKGIDTYTELDGTQRLRAEPEVLFKPAVGENNDSFAALNNLNPGLKKAELLEEKTFNNILDALTEIQQGVFLGKPGAGKSTTLWKIAYDEITTNDQRQPEKRILPIILRLGLWTEVDQTLQVH